MGKHIFNDQDLLISIANGDQAGFEELFFKYKNLVFAISLKVTANSFDAEEVVQDVFSRIWIYRAGLTDINDLSSWIKAVTRNRALTLLQRRATELKNKQRISAQLTAVAPGSADGDIQRKEFQSLIRKSMGGLSPQQRKIFVLSKLHGMDRNAIARNLGLSATTVSNHLTAALKIVRAYLFKH